MSDSFKGEEGFPDGARLGEARAWLREQVRHDGAKCPVCRQFAKVYRRSINSAMARGLIVCWRAARQEPFHLPTVIGHLAGDHAKLRYWGLLDEENREREDGGRAGWYRITDDGLAFVQGVGTVPKYALIYDSQLLGLDGPDVTIRDALGARFDLRELLAADAEEVAACF